MPSLKDTSHISQYGVEGSSQPNHSLASWPRSPHYTPPVSTLFPLSVTLFFRLAVIPNTFVRLCAHFFLLEFPSFFLPGGKPLLIFQDFVCGLLLHTGFLQMLQNRINRSSVLSCISIGITGIALICCLITICSVASCPKSLSVLTLL